MKSPLFVPARIAALVVAGGLFLSSALSRAADVVIGLNGTPGYSWADFAASGPLGGAANDIRLFPANPLTVTVVINEPGVVTGTFDVTFNGSTTQTGQTVRLANSRENLLVVDRAQTLAGGDDYNINANEDVQFSVSNINLTSLDGGTPELHLGQIATTALNAGEFLDVSLNGVLVHDNLEGSGAANTTASSLSFVVTSNPLANGDTVLIDLVTAGGVSYRIQSVGFSATSVGGGVEEPEPPVDDVVVIGSAGSGAAAGHTWPELAAGGTVLSSGATVFPTQPRTLTIPVNTAEVTGEFQLILSAGLTNGSAANLAEYLGRLVVDRATVDTPADDRNINGSEDVIVTVGNINLTARKGGVAQLSLDGFSTFDLSDGEAIELRRNNTVAIPALTGTGAAGSGDVKAFDLAAENLALVSGDMLVWRLSGASLPSYRLDALSFRTAVTVPAYQATGDRYPQVNAVYPAAAFAAADVRTNPARWDVTDDKKLLNAVTHFGAIGDGDPAHAAHNTAAFRAMYDFLKARAIQHDGTGFESPEAPGAQWMFYIPDGVYCVNDTISDTGAVFDYFRGVRIIGQSRAGTIIRLVDNAPGFDQSASPKILLSFRNPGDDFNNWQGHNMLKNITIDVGSGNPGAVGVDYFSPNTGRIDNVTISSAGGANRYAGAIGLNLNIGIVHGFFSNLTVDGFDTGINFEPYHHCNPALEHITLTNQKTAAIRAVNGVASLREVLSIQTRSDPGADAAGIVIDSRSSTSAGAHIVAIDSQLVSNRSPASTRPAIELVSNGGQVGHLFARNVGFSGYATGVVKAGATVVAGNVNEYVSDAPVGFDASSPGVSMRLPIEEYPVVAWDDDLTQWTSPDDHASPNDVPGDDSAAIQRALDSGKPVIYFPKQAYAVSRVLRVPATVKRIDLMATELVGPTVRAYFDITEASAEPLLIHDLNDGSSPLMQLSAARTLVLDSNRNSSYRNNGTTGQKIFVNSANKFLRFVSGGSVLEDTTVWGRFINTEDKVNPNCIVGRNGMMWVLGYKCEGPTVNFRVQDGGFLEVLGGIANQYPNDQADWNQFAARPSPNNAALVNVDGNLSYVGSTNGPTSPTFVGFRHLVSDVQNGVTVTVDKADLPLRLGRPDEVVVPLYTSYHAALVPQEPYTNVF